MSRPLTTIARRLDFIRETTGPNRGAWVEFLQRFCEGVPGDSWCADFVSVVLDIAYYGAPPLKATGSTFAMLTEAQAAELTVAVPDVNDLYFFLRPNGLPHHVGIVTALVPLTGIAGNTSPDGLSANGTGVFEHAIPVTHTVFVRLP